MSLIYLLAETTDGIIPTTMALAAVALIGYLFGQRTRQVSPPQNNDLLRSELANAVHIAKELQQVAQKIRQDVSAHQSKIARFRSRVHELCHDQSDASWQTLSDEAEALLNPTMKLANELSFAYDQLRQQSSQLMNFANTRTDPETGVHNRRAMEEQLEVLFSSHKRNDTRFSVALFSCEKLYEEASTDSASASLDQFVSLLENCARDTDLIGRYSSEEFIVLMPQTSLQGAAVFSHRLLRRIDNELGLATAGGIAEVQPSDTPEKILSRAGSALYSARTENDSCLYQHDGKMARVHEESNSCNDQDDALADTPHFEPAI